MKEISVDIDKKQALKDLTRRNRYKLDDRFVIRDGERHKCAILCPGGAYSSVCSFIEGVPIAERLNKKGISAVIVYYRVKKEAIFPNPQDDLARAVKEVFDRKDKYNLDMTDYSVWGSSAGGHLAGTFGTSSMGYKHYGLEKPSALILSYPVISLEKDITHMETRDNLLGADASEVTAQERSIHTNVDADYPPTFLWCGDADSTVSPENTRIMEDALTRNGIKHKCTIFPGVEHGVGPGTGTAAEGWIDEAVKFWL